MKKRKGQMSESFLLGAMLAVVGGFLDAYTYLLRGGVFANAQTGNMVLLGISAVEGNFLKALYYLIPIGAFALGVVAAEAVRHRFRTHPRIHWRQIVVAAEFVLLLVAAFVPQGDFDVAVNVAVSFMCAMQVESFRKVNGNAFASTMCTGNLRSATERLWRYHLTKDRSERNRGIQYLLIILFFVIGAAVGALFSKIWGVRAVLFCCILLSAGFGVMFIKEDVPELEEELKKR